LFDAALARTMREATASKPLQPDETPGEYTARTFDFHREQPELLQLLMWEALSRPVASAVTDTERQDHYDEKIKSMMVMAGLQEQDARFALFTVLALATYAHAFPQVTTLVMGQEHVGDELRARLAESLDRFLGSGRSD